MSFVGDIQDLSVLEILQTLGRGEHTGLLTVTSQNAKGWVVLHKGNVVFASCTTSPKLGHRLVRKGLVPVGKLKEIMRRQRRMQSQASLGTLIVDRGLISKEKLEKELFDHTVRVLGDIFGLETGVFQFDKNLSPNRYFLWRNGFKVEMLLLEYMRAKDEKPRTVHEALSGEPNVGLTDPLAVLDRPISSDTPPPLP